MTLLEFSELVRNLGLPTAAGVGAYTAWRGLKTWKREYVFKADFDLSRRLLVSLQHYRSAIEGVRRPGVYSYETQPSKDETDPVDPDQKLYIGLERAYVRRWDEVARTRTDLAALITESRGLWGDGFSELFVEIKKLENELSRCLRHFLAAQDPRKETEARRIHNQLLKENRKIMDDAFDTNDPFQEDFLRALEPVEKYLGDKLGRVRP
ncbi:hypothetical protein [Actibacterium sp. 188UL27-1]|uniref:hypothetical protein n=1 Tax=Actibacterium sp. 188UL27-1 TaxID=2786961 RepID=UPI00195B9F0A|nr:hypothetical protein [Actibacterium sp. 188UL27-1]MBM7066373.1 hypothetical protein [Actibacterium sp. 188UL27-1]